MRVPEPLPPRYANARLLGEGSFARVYAAEDTLLGCAVAIKLLREEIAGDATSRRRFAREIRTTAAVAGHPHVVTVHDAGEWRGVPYLVLELLAGSVAERLREDVPEPLAVRWLAQAAAALDFAHARGIVHRDVKPANLLLDDAGDVRVADFGVARGETLGEALTLAGSVVGSPGYLAPEVAAGARATAAADVYGLAVIARELLGDRPGLDRALSPRPEERPGTAAELVAALGGAEPPTRVLHRPRRTIARIARTAVAPAAVPQRRHRAVHTGVAAAVLAAVAAGSAAGGALIAGHVTARAASGHAAGTQRRAQICALSPFDHDANVVVRGVGASAFCRAQAHALRLDGYSWTYRAGGELIAPDHGTDGLAAVCRLHRNLLSATVYDSGSRAIGTRVCGWYASGAWRRS